MLMEIERRIFVVGVPRSGTTLVQSLLAAHSAVTSFTESHLFSRHFTLFGPGPTPILVRDPGPRLVEFLAENEAGPAPGPVVSRDDLSAVSPPVLFRPWRTRLVAERLLHVFDRLAQFRGRPSWVEKTCRHLRYTPYLERLVGPTGGFHVVHVVREGLDVVASLHTASQRWERPYALPECATRWNEDVAFSLRHVGALHHHVVFYEDITAHPRATLEPLLASLGLRWEPGVLVDYGAAAESLVTENEPWKADVGRKIARSATARERLTPAQRQQVTGQLDEGLYRRLRHHAATGSTDREGAPAP